MATARTVLNIQLLPETARVLENVARLRTGQMNPQATVDLGAYIFTLLNRDVAACLEEIKARRGA
jgi:hypothetical protein